MAKRRPVEDGPTPYDVIVPPRQTAPVVFASPHSGTDYPAAFVSESPLDLLSLRRSEDSFVDELFAPVVAHGMPLLRALFPRAYIDPNREPFELDPDMFEDALPAYANTQSSRVAAGLGTIARVVCSGQEIYAAKLRFADAAARIDGLYRPYHRALKDLLDRTRSAFGCVVLVDCHSMPSVGGPNDPDAGRRRPDIVLGDCFGASCAEGVMQTVEDALAGQGLVVTRNRPFAGGFTTRHYGRPREGQHAIQIEINRALYMDEARIQPAEGMRALGARLVAAIEALAAIDPSMLRIG